MNEGMISKRYAKALLQFAAENKNEEAVFNDMKLLRIIFAKQPELRLALDNPTLTTSDKLKLIETAVGGKPTKEFSRFANLVLENRREKFFREMCLSYIDLYSAEKGINIGKLITASKVDNATIEKMKELLTKVKPGGTLDFDTEIDPSIEGGFILYVDTYRLDASVTNQLKRIKQQFIIENSKIL